MAKVAWLKLIRGTTLELPGLVDYAGQPLVFRMPALVKRCVSADLLEHAFVKRYVAQGMLAIDQATVARAAAPAVVPAAPVVKPVEVAPVAVQPPPPPPEPVVESAPQQVEVEASEEVVAEQAAVSDGPTLSPETTDPSPEPPMSMAQEVSKPTTDTPRRRRRG